MESFTNWNYDQIKKNIFYILQKATTSEQYIPNNTFLKGERILVFRIKWSVTWNHIVIPYNKFPAKPTIFSWSFAGHCWKIKVKKQNKHKYVFNIYCKNIASKSSLSINVSRISTRGPTPTHVTFEHTIFMNVAHAQL